MECIFDKIDTNVEVGLIACGKMQWCICLLPYSLKIVSIYHMLEPSRITIRLLILHFLSFAVDTWQFSIIWVLACLYEVGCSRKGHNEKQDKGHNFVYGYSDSAFQIGLFVIFNILSDEAWLAWEKKNVFLQFTFHGWDQNHGRVILLGLISWVCPSK